MPQSLANLYVHLIFSTKERYPFLMNKVRTELYPYIAKTLQTLECPATAIGGTEDHMHIVSVLSRTKSVAELIREIKTPASQWLKTKGGILERFAWQNGYAAFSVSQSALSRVAEYVENQEEHYRTQSFQDEFRAFLERNRIAFDERYVWD